MGIYAVFHEIIEDTSSGQHLIALDESLMISISRIDQCSTLSFTKNNTARLHSDGTISGLTDAVSLHKCNLFLTEDKMAGSKVFFIERFHCSMNIIFLTGMEGFYVCTSHKGKSKRNDGDDYTIGFIL